MESSRRAALHWRTPATLLSFFAIGSSLALLHHLFFASLRGSPVASGRVDLGTWDISQQQLNIAAGTALAFLVKAALVLATSIAYWQVLYRHLSRKAFTLSKLDNWHSALENVISLVLVIVDWRYPLLTLVAITSWCLPLAAIVAPSSLTIINDRIEPAPVNRVLVPLPAFDSEALANLQAVGDDNMLVASAGAQQEVLRIAVATAAAGSILVLPSPGTNATYNVTTVMPRLYCDSMEESLRTQLKENLLVGLNDTAKNHRQSPVTMFSYLAWSSQSASREENEVRNMRTPILPFVRNTVPGRWTLRPAIVDPSPPVFQGQAMDLYVTVFPRTMDQGRLQRWTNSSTEGVFHNSTLLDWYFENATMLTCRLAASEYQLRVSYRGADQSQTIETLSVGQSVDPFIGFQAVVGNGSTFPTLLQILASGWDPELEQITDMGRLALRYLSYASVMQAMLGIVLGASNGGMGANYAKLSTADRHQPDGSLDWVSAPIFSTRLAETEELAAIGQATKQLTDQTWAKHIPAACYEALLNIQQPFRAAVPRMHLQDALEELFFNISISMASSELLRYREGSVFRPDHVEVTFNTFGNVYAYAAGKLWFAYGLAIGGCFLATSIGLSIILLRGASFVADFSTIVRLAKNSKIDRQVEEENPGQDPLPRGLRSARLEIRTSKTPDCDEQMLTAPRLSFSSSLPKDGARTIASGTGEIGTDRRVQE